MQQILQDLYLTPSSSPSPADAASWTANHRGHAVRLSVAGELDIATVDSLTRVAIGALQLPVRVLILDIHGVTFCGAAGVTALVQIQQASSQAGSRLVLTGIQPPVKHVLDLVGLSAMIPILATRNAFPANTDRTVTKTQPSTTPADITEPTHARPLQTA
jgi:anti-sigma B factor antagonist